MRVAFRLLPSAAPSLRSHGRALAIVGFVFACSGTDEPSHGGIQGGSAGNRGSASSGAGGGSSAGSALATAGTAGGAALGGTTSGSTQGGAGGVEVAGNRGGGTAGRAGGGALPEKAYVYLGGGRSGAGVVALYSLSYESGELTLVKSLSVGKNCSFLAVDKAAHALYATDDGGKRVRRLSIDPATWEPVVGSEQPSSGSPVHVSVTTDGKLVLTAQWIQGTIEAFSVSGSKLGASLGSQPACGQAHEVALAPQQDYVFVPCQTDGKLNRYELDRTSGALTALTSTPTGGGTGPRHLAFAPSGRFAYLINEFDSSVYAYSYAAGALTELQRITALPDGFTGASAGAEIAVAPSGTDVYASNRPKGEAGTIAQFRVGPDGKLTANGHQSTGGETPRSFAIDPTGRFVIAGNVDSSSVAVLAIDDTGKLGPAKVMNVGLSPWSVSIVVP